MVVRKTVSCKNTVNMGEEQPQIFGTKPVISQAKIYISTPYIIRY
jgi:hypothetical protein